MLHWIDNCAVVGAVCAGSCSGRIPLKQMMTSPDEGIAPALSDSSALGEAFTGWLTALLAGAAQCRCARSMEPQRLWNQQVQEGRVGCRKLVRASKRRHEEEEESNLINLKR